jgi:hypothetical protein
LIFINYSLIAQSVERRTVNPQVAGSSPARGAKLSPTLLLGFFVAVVLPTNWVRLKKYVRHLLHRAESPTEWQVPAIY